VGLYQSGCTLQEIGDAVGLSRERVRQIVARAGYTARHYGKHTSLVDPPPELLKATGLTTERRVTRRLNRNSWRFRLCVWLIRDFIFEHGYTPTAGEIFTLIHPDRTTRDYSGKAVGLRGYLDPPKGTVAAHSMPYRDLTRRLWGTAGVPQPRRGYQVRA